MLKTEGCPGRNRKRNEGETHLTTMNAVHAVGSGIEGFSLIFRAFVPVGLPANKKHVKKKLAIVRIFGKI